MKKTLMKVAVLGALLLSSAASLAQADLADKPIRIVVPFAPGGASDAVARPIAQAMAAILAVPVVVENKAGAAGNIALETVARAPADGHMLLLGNVSTNAMNETSYAHSLKIVPTKDLTAVGLVALTPSVLASYPGFAPKTGAELVAHARAHPGKINYWLPGIASGPHFVILQLEKVTNIRMTGVPFSGGAGPGVMALIGGQVDIGLVNLGSALPHIRGGKLRALAVSSSERLSELPDVPTATEAGLCCLDGSWQGLFAPAATPRPIVRKLHAALNEAMSRPEVKEAIARAASFPTPSKTPEEAQAYVKGETERWARIIIDSGVKAE